MIRLPVLLIGALLLSGCTSVKALFAMGKSTDHFMPLEASPFVKYEMGSKEYADTISNYYSEAINAVVTKQFGTFPGEVTIYVPGTVDSFAAFCASKKPSACVVGNRLFLSPRLQADEGRIPHVLAHEMSHLQLSQSIGQWKYQMDVPTWFSEGLAVYVSGGSGAERVTKDEAVEAIKAGKSIVPNGSGGLLFRKTASSFNLAPHMFYRQSALYVEWLHDRDEGQFKALIELLRRGYTVGEAMISSYGFTVSQGWGLFVDEVS